MRMATDILVSSLISSHIRCVAQEDHQHRTVCSSSCEHLLSLGLGKDRAARREQEGECKDRQDLRIALFLDF